MTVPLAQINRGGYLLAHCAIAQETMTMNPNATPIRRYALPAYLILTPLISIAIPLLLPRSVELAVLLMLLVPSLMAIVLTLAAEGRPGLANLLGKLFRWRVNVTGYALALGLPIVLVLGAAVLGRLLDWLPELTIRVPAPSQLVFNLVLVVLIAVLEELGWRGYALPRLLASRSVLFSALLVGVLWGGLHTPLGVIAGRPWVPSFLAPVGLSVVMTWLFLHTRGSLSMAMQFHFVFDYLPQFLFAENELGLAIWLQAIVSLAVALILILVFGVTLQRGHSKLVTASPSTTSVSS
jgi:membrane protease YdiL (CAAX protease family)